MTLNWGLGITGLLGMAGAMGLGLSLLPEMQSRLFPKPTWRFLHDHLPFDRVNTDGKTLISKDGTCSQVFRLQGLNAIHQTGEEIDRIIKKRQLALDVLSPFGARFNIFTLRSKVGDSVPAEFDNPVLQKIQTRWQEPFSETYLNEHFLVIIQPPLAKAPWKPKVPALGLLQELASLVEEGLSDFSPEILPLGQGYRSPLLSFWAQLIHGEATPIQAKPTYLSQRVGVGDVVFEPKSGLIQYPSGKWGQILSLQLWGEECSSQILQRLQSVSGELIIYHALETKPKAKALLELEISRRQSLLLGGQADREAFEASQDWVKSDECSLLYYQLSVVLLVDNLDDLPKLQKQVKSVFHDFGMSVCLNKASAQWLWFSQFPAQDALMRPTRLLSHQLAHFLHLHQEPVGLGSCDWGDGPIRLLKTITGGSYRLQLHVSEQKEALANAIFVAPSGSGKTMLCQHLMGGALRHPNLRAFIFDRYNGTRIFTEGVKGHYIDLAGRSGVPLNPFYCEDTPQNRTFLREFLAQLARVPLSDSKIEARISIALDILFYLPPSQRILSEILPIMDSSSDLKHGLERWTGNNPLAHWFNGQRRGEAFDALDISASRLVAFEMTDILKSEDLSGVVTRYLMHRIMSVVKSESAPHWIFIDETKQMLKCPIFKNYLDSLLLENRKLRGAITLCFQAAKDITDSGMGNVILEQCPTRFLFPNPSAKAEDYAIFDLSPAEWRFIKGEHKLSARLNHAVLLKRPQESVILDVDLAPLGSLMNLYRSGSEFNQQVKQLQAQWGDAWVEHYWAA